MKIAVVDLRADEFEGIKLKAKYAVYDFTSALEEIREDFAKSLDEATAECKANPSLKIRITIETVPAE